MRYTNGFKSNFEINFSKNESKSDCIMARKAIKKQRNLKYASIGSSFTFIEFDNSSVTNNLENYQTQELPKEIGSYNKKVGLIPTKLSLINSDSSKKQPIKKLPIEGNIKTGAILFYTGIIFSILSSPLSSPLFGYVGIAFLLIGFIVSCIGLHNFNKAPKLYRGEGLAISVIVIFLVQLITTLLFIILLLAFI